MKSKLFNYLLSVVLFLCAFVPAWAAQSVANPPALSSYIPVPAGQSLVISHGAYYFTAATQQAGVSAYTTVPGQMLQAAKDKQLAWIHTSLIASGYSTAAAAVYFGLVTPANIGLVPPVGTLVTENSAGQVISWEWPLPFGNTGYVTVKIAAPASANLPVVGTTSRSDGALVSTGKVLNVGAKETGHGPVIPQEPDTVMTPQATPEVSVYVGAPTSWTPPTGASPAYQTYDDVPDGTYVQWFNPVNNGAPVGFYLKHQTSVKGPFGPYVTRWYEAVDPSAVPPSGVIQANH
jgi:hypothetical protein